MRVKEHTLNTTVAVGSRSTIAQVQIGMYEAEGTSKVHPSDVHISNPLIGEYLALSRAFEELSNTLERAAYRILGEMEAANRRERG